MSIANVLVEQLRQRLYRTVDRSSPNGCWTWQGTVTMQGYGKIMVAGRVFLAHRLSVELTSGPIPEGLLVCHKCDNPPCVNPDHLFLGTKADNTADMMAKGRHRFARFRGEFNRRAILTEVAVRDIRASRKKGMILKELAKKYGVTIQAIWLAERGHSWKHVA